MRQWKYLFLISLPIIMLIANCKKEEEINSPKPIDNLEQIGILGKWWLQSRTIDGITSMIIHYDTLEFMVDQKIVDLKGKFRSKNGQVETNGQFNLDTTNQLIQFDYNETQKYYKYSISDELMIFAYSEDSLEIIEEWRKE